MKWYRNRFVGAAAILLATSAGAVVLATTADSEAKPPDARSAAGTADLHGQIMTRMRTTLERTDPGQHHHAGHQAQQAATPSPVICGVRVYGYEPAAAAVLADVRTVYGFHLCGVAETKRPWDVAVKLAGPVILDMSREPAGIQVVEATADVMFADRLRQMFPAAYADLALKEALAPAEMADLRRRYNAAAGV